MTTPTQEGTLLPPTDAEDPDYPHWTLDIRRGPLPGDVDRYDVSTTPGGRITVRKNFRAVTVPGEWLADAVAAARAWEPGEPT